MTDNPNGERVASVLSSEPTPTSTDMACSARADGRTVPSPHAPDCGSRAGVGETAEIPSDSGRSATEHACLCKAMCKVVRDQARPDAERAAEQPETAAQNSLSNEAKPGRTAHGKFAAGNSIGAGTRFESRNKAAQTTGVRAFTCRGVAALDAELRAALDRFHAGVVVDQGGEHELSTVRAGYVRKLVSLEAITELLSAEIQTRGVLTVRGRVRGTFLAFLKSLEQWDRYAQRLGTDRRPKSVPSLAEYLTTARPHAPAPSAPAAERGTE